MKLVKVLIVVGVSAFSIMSTSAYETVDCSTEAIFGSNSCDQCFTGDAKGEGDNLGFLKDEWNNTSNINKILYKEEQEMPKMKNLSPSLVTWKQLPSANKFWEYTDAFNALYKDEEEGYVLAKGKKVDWLQSKKGYAYSLTKNKAATGVNIGLLVYPISVHDFASSGEISVDSTDHKECVLFKSGKAKVVKKVTPKEKPIEKLPETGPENYIFLLLIAMVMGFGIMKIRKKI